MIQQVSGMIPVRVAEDTSRPQSSPGFSSVLEGVTPPSQGVTPPPDWTEAAARLRAAGVPQRGIDQIWEALNSQSHPDIARTVFLVLLPTNPSPDTWHWAAQDLMDHGLATPSEILSGMESAGASPSFLQSAREWLTSIDQGNGPKKPPLPAAWGGTDYFALVTPYKGPFGMGAGPAGTSLGYWDKNGVWVKGTAFPGTYGDLPQALALDKRGLPPLNTAYAIPGATRGPYSGPAAHIVNVGGFSFISDPSSTPDSSA